MKVLHPRNVFKDGWVNFNKLPFSERIAMLSTRVGATRGPLATSVASPYPEAVVSKMIVWLLVTVYSIAKTEAPWCSHI